MSLWLAKDQRSNEVVALQNALNLRLKPVKPLVLDGIFGPLTEGAPGLAFGTVIVGEKEAEGRLRMNWFGAEGKLQLGLKYGIGRRHRH